MGAVAKLHALEVKRSLVDLQLIGVIRTVQQYADAALVNTGGILVGELTVRIHRREGEVTAAQHSRAVPGQHRAATRLRNGFQHWSGNVVGVGTVDELDIIHQNMSLDALFHQLRLYDAEGIGAVDINGHLHGGDICLHPEPSLAGHFAQSTQGNLVSVGVLTLAVILGVHGRALGDRTHFAVNTVADILHTAVSF